MARFSFQPIHTVLRAVIPLPLAYRARMAARERRAMRLEEDSRQDLELDLDAPFETPLDTQPVGPGWYTSTWELTRGLEVREGLPADAKLHEWLEVCLLA